MINSAISIKNLSVYYGEIGAVNNISLDIKKGEFVGIIGPNGGGKTTLLSAALGLISPQRGEIEILGSNIKKGRKSVGYVPQIAAVDRDFPISVKETVMTAFLKSGLHPFKTYSKEEKQRALEALKKVGLESFAERQINELSGGEFQRLLIARALAANPEILILDEPTSNIDKESKSKIYNVLKEMNKNGITVITVTHDLQGAAEIFSRLIHINQTVNFDGLPSNYLNGGGINA